MNLLIVDDEHHVVNYMAMLAEESAGNMLEIYKAYSGSEALQVLAEIKINIIFLDIQMPGMTGLELAKKISQTWLNCRIIFLTAYDSFEYIYSATEFSHASYLLKTEPNHVIVEALQHAINSIQNEQEQKTILDDTLKRNKYLSHLLQQHFLRMLQFGVPLEVLRSENALLGTNNPINIDTPVYLMYMNIQHSSFKDRPLSDYNNTLQYLRLTEYHSSEKFSCSLLQLDNGDGLWFFQYNENTDFGLSNPVAFLRNMADNLASDFEFEIHRKITLLLYPHEVKCSEVHQIFQIIHTSIEKMDFSVPYPTVIMCSQDSVAIDRAFPTESNLQVESFLGELNYYLTHGCQQDFFGILDQLQRICQAKRSMHNLSCIRIYNTIALDLLNYIDTYQLQEDLSTHTAIYPLYHIQDFPDWKHAFQYLKTCSYNIFYIMEQKGANRNNSTIEKIQKYIQSNLNCQLNLSSIAAIVNYNETYVSRLFRQHTGMKLSDYILQERLIKAKHLLSTTKQSINSIAEDCGFDSIHYFSYTFKKIVGMSPSDYRRNIQ